MISSYIKLFIIIGLYSLFLPVYADNLGTLFTSAKERQKLEKVRDRILPKKMEVVQKGTETEIEIEEFVVKKEVIIRDPISIKGIVHRSNGKSAAWINEGNTFEGSLDAEFIQVPSNEIKTDQVTVKLTDDESEYQIKVGETYIPEPLEIDTVK
jgi:hypothetical protein